VTQARSAHFAPSSARRSPTIDRASSRSTSYSPGGLPRFAAARSSTMHGRSPVELQFRAPSVHRARRDDLVQHAAAALASLIGFAFTLFGMPRVRLGGRPISVARLQLSGLPFSRLGDRHFLGRAALRFGHHSASIWHACTYGSMGRPTGVVRETVGAVADAVGEKPR